MHARYLDACMLDCLRRGEAPFASHGLYTRPGVLDDLKPEERRLGIYAGFAWRQVAEGSIFYIDLGWTGGMNDGLVDAGRVKVHFEHEVEERRLGGEWARGYALIGEAK